MSIATIYFADSGLFRLKPCYWNLGLKEYTDPLHTQFSGGDDERYRNVEISPLTDNPPTRLHTRFQILQGV